MSNIKQTRISLRKGLKSDLPSHAPLGEPLYCTDTGEIYVGMGNDSPLKKVGETDFNYLNSKFVEVNVKDFGAKGDGVTDDSLAIQKAYDFVKDTGGTVFFPRGIYIVSMTREDPILNGHGELNSIIRTGILVKGNNITTKGEGCNLTIIKMYPSNYRKNGTISGLLSSIFTLECSLDSLRVSQHNITFEGIQLNGGRGEWNQAVLDKDFVVSNGNPGEIGTHGKGIHARTVAGSLENLLIKDCIIQNMYAEGTHSHKAVNTIVENTLFSYNRPAGGNLSGSVTYKNCTFRKHYTFNLEHAHAEENKGTNYLKIIGCKFYDLDTRTQSHIVSNYKAQGTKNTGMCVIEDCDFFLEDDSLDTKCSIVTLTGYNSVKINNIRAKTKCSEAFGILPIVLRDCKNVVIDGNYFDVLNSPVYFFSKNTKGCSYTITNNRYSDNVTREFATGSLKDTFGNNCIIKHYGNEFEGKSCGEPVSLTANVSKPLFLNKIVSLIGTHELLLDFSTRTMIKELYYIEPVRFGGDGVRHVITFEKEVQADTMYTFSFTPTPKLNKDLNPNSGIEFMITTTDDCTVNYRII